MGSRLTEARWRERFRRWRRSGESVAAFCRAEGVSDTSFYKWRRRLEEAGITDAPSLEFVEVQGAQPTVTVAIEIEVSEFVVRLARGVDADDLRTVLKVIGERP